MKTEAVELTVTVKMGDEALTALLDWLLEKARSASRRAADRMRLLREHYPADVPPLAGGREERRASPRSPRKPARVTAHALDCPALLEMASRDESASGVGLWSPQAVAGGTMLYLLPAGAPEGSTGTLVRVRQCRPAVGGWVVGCQVVRRPEE